MARMLVIIKGAYQRRQPLSDLIVMPGSQAELQRARDAFMFRHWGEKLAKLVQQAPPDPEEDSPECSGALSPCI
jgi:hypothetical protein